jgi:hypothetical protein
LSESSWSWPVATRKTCAEGPSPAVLEYRLMNRTRDPSAAFLRFDWLRSLTRTDLNDTSGRTRHANPSPRKSVSSPRLVNAMNSKFPAMNGKFPVSSLPTARCGPSSLFARDHRFGGLSARPLFSVLLQSPLPSTDFRYHLVVLDVEDSAARPIPRRRQDRESLPRIARADARARTRAATWRSRSAFASSIVRNRRTPRASGCPASLAEKRHNRRSRSGSLASSALVHSARRASSRSRNRWTGTSLLRDPEFFPQRCRVGPIDGPDGPFLHPIQGGRGRHLHRYAFNQDRFELEVFEGER